MSVVIRRLAAADVKAYRDIRLEALKVFPQSYGSTYANSKMRPISSFADMIENNTMFGVFCDKSLAGIACFANSTGAQDSHVGHIYQIYVQAKHQGKGLGTQLFNAIFAHAKTLVKQIHLGVGTKNHAAMALYKKFGFEIYGTEPRALMVNGQYIDEHLMVKFLDQKESK